MPTLMVCPNCGGPLPELVAEAPFVACWYCGATSNVDARVVTQREAVGRDPAAEARAAEERTRALTAFHEALEALSGSSPVAYDEFRELCHRHLQVLGRTDSVARIAYNLALDAERDLHESVRTRGGVLARLAVAYMDAVGHLRDQPQYELNLPFLFATPQGPRHYRRTLDVPTIQALAERDPAASLPAAGPKKRLWSRLFG